MATATIFIFLLYATLALCRSTSSPLAALRVRTDNDNSGSLKVNFSAGPSEPGTPPSLELVAARRALKKLKFLLGPEALLELLAGDIDAGNAAWHAILAASPPDNPDPTAPDQTPHVVAEIHLTAIPDDCAHHTPVNFTAYNFLAWFTDSAFNHADKLWAGHPEHFGLQTTPNTDGTMRAELLEPWGPVLTRSVVPRLAAVMPGGGVKKPFMKPLPDFPFQSVGEETLMDGTGAVVGDIHYSWKDLPGKKAGKACGVEGLLNMWMPSATPDNVKEGITQHITVEYYNWVKWAYDDIKSGAFVPS
ncbi:hypothetical protein B0T25DRAFT_544121 [Lasiosphaeria hispida]|uniref:Uncharacterized protein n=1 Tax=Lasiosphaeria hispida TaxID=260671 RepID=A0AAJ0MEB0_9PEZI|nr:hypothetical protein B0T25DRAFT_544121 [Lasiosphaeria hispida]